MTSYKKNLTNTYTKASYIYVLLNVYCMIDIHFTLVYSRDILYYQAYNQKCWVIIPWSVRLGYFQRLRYLGNYHGSTPEDECLRFSPSRVDGHNTDNGCSQGFFSIWNYQKTITENHGCGKTQLQIWFTLLELVGFSNLGWVSTMKMGDMGVVQLLIGDAWWQ